VSVKSWEMVQRRVTAAAMLAAVSLISFVDPIQVSASHSALGNLHSPANHAGFQHTHSLPNPSMPKQRQAIVQVRLSSWPMLCRTTRSRSWSDPRLSATFSPMTKPSSTVLFLETKECEAVNDDVEYTDDKSKKINGSIPSVDGVNGAKDDVTSSSDLAEFFERIFQKESFGALANISSNGHASLNGDIVGQSQTTGVIDDAMSDIQRSIKSLTVGAEENNVPNILDLTVDFANEVYQNMTGNDFNASTNIDLLASSSTTFSDDLPTEITNSITELFRKLEVALDERFVEACEEIAFYDVQGLRSNRDALPGPKRLLEEDYERMRREGDKERERLKKVRVKNISRLQGNGMTKFDNKTQTAPGGTYLNEVAVTSKRMRTTEILRNFNAAPIFYTIALSQRWIQKASVPPMAVLMFFRGLAYPFKWREGRSPASITKAAARRRLFGKRAPSDPTDGRIKIFGDEQIADEEFIQGWKRTGEIAAKGKRGRALATFRRSAEIWFYFSSFYIKDTWILKNYNSGRWSKLRFEDERRKLGGQLTQNLLRLGPTFIKVNFFLLCLFAEHRLYSLLLLLPTQQYLLVLSLAWTNLLHPYRHCPKGVPRAIEASTR
jgi:hypothetical protein